MEQDTLGWCYNCRRDGAKSISRKRALPKSTTITENLASSCGSGKNFVHHNDKDCQANESGRNIVVAYKLSENQMSLIVHANEMI